MTDTPYDRIGGAPAIQTAVDIFYRKVLADDTISDFFDTVDMDRQRAKQAAFLTMVLGGPNAYTGKDMRAGHAHLVRQGLNEGHFNAVAGHLSATLAELGAPADLIATVMTTVTGAKNDVLGL